MLHDIVYRAKRFRTLRAFHSVVFVWKIDETRRVPICEVLHKYGPRLHVFMCDVCSAFSVRVSDNNWPRACAYVVRTILIRFDGLVCSRSALRRFNAIMARAHANWYGKYYRNHIYHPLPPTTIDRYRTAPLAFRYNSIIAFLARRKKNTEFDDNRYLQKPCCCLENTRISERRYNFFVI